METYDTKPTTTTTTTSNAATTGRERRKKRSQSILDVKKCLNITPTMRPSLKNVLILSTQRDSNKPMVISFDGEFHLVSFMLNSFSYFNAV